LLTQAILLEADPTSNEGNQGHIFGHPQFFFFFRKSKSIKTVTVKDS